MLGLEQLLPGERLEELGLPVGLVRRISQHDVEGRAAKHAGSRALDGRRDDLDSVGAAELGGVALDELDGGPAVLDESDATRAARKRFEAEGA